MSHLLGSDGGEGEIGCCQVVDDSVIPKKEGEEVVVVVKKIDGRPFG